MDFLGSGGGEHKVDRRMALASEWDNLVSRARDLPGLENFLLPPTPESVLPSALTEPVILVNVSDIRCDAIIASSRGVSSVALPNMTAASVVDWVGKYLRALLDTESLALSYFRERAAINSGNNSRESHVRYVAVSRAYTMALRDRETLLGELTEWMWDRIAEPVLTGLGKFLASEDLPRVWWCPTGILSLLPLHAAGYHQEAGGRTLLDRVISSYTPTLGALRRSVRKVETSNGRMLLVALTETPGQIPLPSVGRERDVLTTLLPESCTVLENNDANWSSVRSNIEKHSYVHFSCHGTQDLLNPLKGGLLLYDQSLSIADVMALNHPGEFAFLSACKTAVGGVALADEAITLAAALHYAGYRHVIGTLWSVYDSTAAEVSEGVYRRIVDGGALKVDRSSYALHEAVRVIRDSGEHSLSAWMPFVHIGP